MNELYRDFVDRKANEIINDLGGTITPAPPDETYREFLDRKFDDVINALPSSPSSGHNYSLNEQIVGKWIDGNPVYEKTIYCDSFPNNTDKYLSTPSDIDILIDVEGFMKSTTLTGYFRTLPFAGGGTNDVRVDLNGGVLRVVTFSNWSSYDGYITIRYTKIVT